jgi:hypothetical protein
VSWPDQVVVGALEQDGLPLLVRVLNRLVRESDEAGRRKTRASGR